MNRVKVSMLLSALSLSMLTGCSQLDSIKAKFSKSDESQGYVMTPEDEALIGTYTEDGALITGFDENGWMITEGVDTSYVTQNNLGLTAQDLLSSTTTYDEVTIVTRNNLGTVLNVSEYKMDYNSRTGKRNWYTQNQSIGSTYYDIKSNKAYSNIGMVVWEEQNNERLDNLMMIFNTSYFTLEDFSSDDVFIYVKGSLAREALGDNSVLMKEIYKQIPTATEMELFNIYNLDDKRLFHSEITVTCPQGVYTVTAAPTITGEYITIPEYVTNPVIDHETEIKEGIVNIPKQAYLYSALYMTDKPEIITRDWLINEYQFKATVLEEKYTGIDVEVFLERMQTIDDEMSVEQFLNSYAEKSGSYDTPEENAVYFIIYDRLKELDTSIDEEKIAAMVIKPEEPESVEGEEQSTEEQVEEPQYTVMIVKGAPNVNKRTGPGTNYDKDGQVHEGDEINVIGQSEENADWMKCIDAEGKEFYIKSNYLKAKE